MFRAIGTCCPGERQYCFWSTMSSTPVSLLIWIIKQLRMVAGGARYTLRSMFLRPLMQILRASRVVDEQQIAAEIPQQALWQAIETSINQPLLSR